jgi:murein DD-endopeptidase MepM/ murein hydrolase activator NlpD
MRALESVVTSRPAPGRYSPGAFSSGASSKVLSIGALLFSGALLVAVTVPANAFVDSSMQSPGTAAVDVEEQNIRVSAEVAPSAPVRDSFEVMSYAQVLALTYRPVDYSYTATSGSVRWPFPYSVPINDGFGERSDGFHKGIDMMAGNGTPIYAIADGVATTSVYDGSGYGQHVVVRHNIGGSVVESVYAHMIEGSSPIAAGQPIKVGDFLGLVGDTGYATVSHLHFEIHLDGTPVDPFAWLQANAV